MNDLLNMNIDLNPTRVELELTESCNLKCAFCYNSQKPIISIAYDAIIERLIKEGVLEIVLTGGEPMTHPDFKYILQKCSNSFSKVMIQTNGTFIDGDLAAYIKKCNVTSVNVSVHGLRDIHEKLTGVQGSYNRAIKGIINLLNYDVKVSSNFVITDNNVEYLYDSIMSLYRIGVRSFSMTRFTPTGVGKTNHEIGLTLDNLLFALKTAKSIMQKYPNISIIMANSVPACALSDELMQFCEHCHFGISRFYVDVAGNALMCGMSRIALGNILESSFKDLKSNSEIYKKHVCGEDVPIECKSCLEFRRCRGGCRAAAYASNNNIYGKDPYFSRKG